MRKNKPLWRLLQSIASKILQFNWLAPLDNRMFVQIAQMELLNGVIAKRLEFLGCSVISIWDNTGLILMSSKKRPMEINMDKIHLLPKIYEEIQEGLGDMPDAEFAERVQGITLEDW